MPENLLIYAPVPLYASSQGFLQENQACNGLRLWAENFETVSVMMPVLTGVAPPSWRPISTVGPNLERINVIPLPTAYRPDRFFQHLPSTARLIQEQIKKADYLSFSIGGLFGDWGSVSCHLAHKMGKPYAIWTDRVESEVVRRTAHVGNWRQRLRARATHRPMFALEKHLIRRSSLGLFHGKETYDTYAPYCRNPQIVHDIHIPKSDHIDAQALDEKLASLVKGPLKIAYVGRADAMKGSLDWITVIKNLAAADMDFQASWLGDGPDLQEMRAQVTEAGLQDRVKLPGFTDDRSEVLKCLRDAHIVMFCHKTPESPRSLIEALASAAPIVGYEGAFARDLISAEGGGLLSGMGDTAELARNIMTLDNDRQKLAQLAREAAVAGSTYDEETVFEHRCELIRRHL